MIMLLSETCFAKTKRRRSRFGRANRKKRWAKKQRQRNKNPQNRVHHLTESRNRFVIHAHNTLQVKIENDKQEDCFVCSAKTNTSYEEVPDSGFNTMLFDRNEIILDSQNNHFFAFNLTHFKVYKLVTEHEASAETKAGKNRYAPRNEARFLYKEVQVIRSEISMKKKKNWNAGSVLKSVRIDNSGLKSSEDILAVFYSKYVFMFNIKRKIATYGMDINPHSHSTKHRPFIGEDYELELVFKDLLKISSKSIKQLVGRDNNLVIVTKKNQMRVYSFENLQHLKLLKTIGRKFFFPDFRSQRLKSGRRAKSKFRIVDVQFAEPLFEEKQKRLRFDFCEEAQSQELEEQIDEDGTSGLSETEAVEDREASSASKKQCLNIRNNMLAVVLIEPYNSKDKWVMDVSLQHLLSASKIRNHKMQYPSNESLQSHLIFGNFRISFLKNKNGVFLRYAGVSKQISEKGQKAKLLFAKRVFKIVFLVFRVADKIRLVQLLVKKNIQILDSPQNLKQKSILFMQHDLNIPSKPTNSYNIVKMHNIYILFWMTFSCLFLIGFILLIIS